MSCYVKIIADSINETGDRITTFELEYPHVIHSQMLTHRMLSRNSSSSRAEPVWSMLNRIWSRSYYPKFWGKEQSGMQSWTEISEGRQYLADVIWACAKYSAMFFAYCLAALGLHKQFVNRLIEPFSYKKIILTGTDFSNFFVLRCSKLASPEMQELAEKMKFAYVFSCPRVLKEGEWHLPYVSDGEAKQLRDLGWDPRVISFSRCTRVSEFNRHGEYSTPKEDYELYNRLVGGRLKHASPAEHQAECAPGRTCANFRGWMSHRFIRERTTWQANDRDEEAAVNNLEAVRLVSDRIPQPFEGCEEVSRVDAVASS